MLVAIWTPRVGKSPKPKIAQKAIILHTFGVPVVGNEGMNMKIGFDDCTPPN